MESKMKTAEVQKNWKSVREINRDKENCHTPQFDSVKDLLYELIEVLVKERLFSQHLTCVMLNLNSMKWRHAMLIWMFEHFFC